MVATRVEAVATAFKVEMMFMTLEEVGREVVLGGVILGRVILDGVVLGGVVPGRVVLGGKVVLGNEVVLSDEVEMDPEVEVDSEVEVDKELADWPAPWVLLVVCTTPLEPLVLFLEE